MKNFSTLLILVCLFTAISTFATSYTLTGSGDNLTLTITGTGFMPNYTSTVNPPWYSQRANIKTLVIENGVDGIGGYAFSGCSDLKVIIEEGTNSLSFGTSVDAQGRLISAFKDCLIESLYLGRNIVTKYNIDGKSYTFNPFENNTTLTTLTISNSITLIADPIFWGCSSLKNIVIEDGTTSLEFRHNSVFYNCPIENLYLGRNIFHEYLLASPFKNNGRLKSLTISDSVTSIQYELFWGCSGLTSAIFGSCLTAIGNNAFSGCNSLQELYVNNPKAVQISPNTFPDNLKSIKTYIPVGATTYYTTDVWKDMYLIGKDNEDILYNATQIHQEAGYLDITVNGKSDEFIFSKIEDNLVVSLNSGVANYYIFVNEIDITTDLQNNSVNITPRNINHIYTYQFAPNNKFVVHVENSGALINQIGVNNMNSVQDLVVSGNLNGTDIAAIRQLPFLMRLDMSNAKIVAGGGAYYSTYTTSANRIGDCFFTGKDRLSIFILPTTIVSIDSYAFGGCVNLKSIEIPNTVTSIGTGAFSGCSSLKNVVIENGNTTLSFGTNSNSSKAFENCPIERLYLGRNISYLGTTSGTIFYSPFSLKTTLTSLIVSNSVTLIREGAFYKCSGLTSLALGNSVSSIGNYAFSECNSITSLIIPNFVTSIENSAFRNCIKLTSLSIGNSVTSIGIYAFERCSKLTSVTLGNSVSSIGDMAFSNCSNILEINSKNSTPPIVTSWTFTGFDKKICTLYVPIDCTTIYWLHPVWKDFLNVKEKDFSITAINSIKSDNEITACIMQEGIKITGCNPRDRVSIYTINGQLVFSSVVGNGFISHSLQKGIYIIQTPKKSLKVIY